VLGTVVSEVEIAEWWCWHLEGLEMDPWGDAVIGTMMKRKGAMRDMVCNIGLVAMGPPWT
jgi:hypothetical protein